ncbi:MAG: DUF4340 domain-containing protein [Candidatus Marinimicrobia bacterium]|nr:DUF4340 domain-containing protein [Candidatus Neomarinimicrobiota bacterium]
MTKNLKISLILLVVLIGIYVVSQRGQSQYSSQSSSLFSVNTDEVNRFLIQNKTDAIELSRQDSTWVISGNDTLVVKSQSIDNFLDKVLLVETGTLVSKNPEKWSKYSVDDSTGTHLALIDADGNTKEYAVFGRSSSDYARNYVRTHKDPQVYLTNESILHYLSTSPTYWGEVPKPEPEAPPANDIIIE